MAYDLYYLALHLDLLYVYPGSIALDLLGGIGCIGFIVQHCIGFIGFNALNKNFANMAMALVQLMAHRCTI
jgi:hypothetical protein